MTREQPAAQSPSISSQLPNSYHSIAADLSSYGMGNMEDFNRHPVLPLQSDLPPPLHRNDGGRDLLGATGEPPLHHTLHGKFLFLFLVLAMAFRPAADKWASLSDTLRHLYR